MKKKYLYLLAAIVTTLVGLVVLSGCMSGPTFSYEYGISEPYDIKSGVIEMRVNTTTRIMLNNSDGGDLRLDIDKATLTANFEDGKIETIVGEGAGGLIPAGEMYEQVLTFNGVPVRYVLVDDPPRFHSLIGSYDVNVSTSGQAKILFVWSPVQKDAKNIRINMVDKPLGDYFSTLTGVSNVLNLTQ